MFEKTTFLKLFWFFCSKRSENSRIRSQNGFSKKLFLKNTPKDRCLKPLFLVENLVRPWVSSGKTQSWKVRGNKFTLHSMMFNQLFYKYPRLSVKNSWSRLRVKCDFHSKPLFCEIWFLQRISKVWVKYFIELSDFQQKTTLFSGVFSKNTQK